MCTVGRGPALLIAIILLLDSLKYIRNVYKQAQRLSKPAAASHHPTSSLEAQALASDQLYPPVIMQPVIEVYAVQTVEHVFVYNTCTDHAACGGHTNTYGGKRCQRTQEEKSRVEWADFQFQFDL